MKKPLKSFLRVIIILISVFLVLGVGFMLFASYNYRALEAEVIEDADLVTIADGTYRGNYRVFPVEAIVDVVIKNHKIEEIQLVKHVNGMGQAAEALPSQVVEAQTLQVDLVSGASFSSKVILLAIEDALTHAAD
ncbi:MAG: FMN-binding protein [Clostridiaceae bacterium]|nr:FMN-binding protein [Clostridiaceae bacterium]